MTGGPWLPSPVVLRLLQTQRMVAPDSYYDGLEVAALPLHEHDDWCPCPAHVEARLLLGLMPDDPFTDTDQPQEAPPVTTKTATLAPCRVCGRHTMPGTVEKPTAGDLSGSAREAMTRRLWTICVTCSGLLGERDTVEGRARLLGDLLSVDPLDPAVLAVAAQDGAVPAAQFDARFTETPVLGVEQPRLGSGSRKRWGHVDRDARRRLTERVAKARRRQAHGARNRRGPCGACGVRSAQAWGVSAVMVPSGGARSDRHRWALCSTCSTAWRHGGSSMPGARGWLTAALIPGARAMMSLPPVAIYAETVPGVRPEDAPGVDTPGAYLGDDLDRLRVWVWRRQPSTAPPEWTDREARLAAARAAVRQPAVETAPLVRWGA